MTSTGETMAGQTFRRPMGEPEQIWQILHENQMWIIVRTLLVTCDRKPSEAEVHRTLSELMRWNPLLRVGITKSITGNTGSGENDSDPWEFQEQLDAQPRLICESVQTDWVKLSEDQVMIPIEDFNAPQFRCHYISQLVQKNDELGGPQCAFVFTFNHSIIDGMSSIALLKKFTSVLNSVMRSQEYKIDVLLKDVLPPIDDYCEEAIANLSLEEGGKELQEQLKLVPMMKPEDLFEIGNLYTKLSGTESSRNPEIPHRTCLILREKSEDWGKQFRISCREHGTTVQAAAQIAGAMALSTIIPPSSEDTVTGNENSKHYHDVSYHLSVDLRSRIAEKVPVEYCGLYIGLLMMNTVKVGPEVLEDKSVFWKLAAESNTAVKEQIRNKTYLGSYQAMKGCAQLMRKFKFGKTNPENENRMEELYTTTYGAWEFPVADDDVVKAQGILAASSVHQAGATIGQQLISINNRLYWTFAYSQRVISREHVLKYIDTVFKILENAI